MRTPTKNLLTTAFDTEDNHMSDADMESEASSISVTPRKPKGK